ncbi:hypothetical protein MFLO_12918, partial [Listeria floridensis FSL S10-1187]
YRGLAKVTLQATLTYTAMNLKKTSFMDVEEVLFFFEFFHSES